MIRKLLLALLILPYLNSFSQNWEIIQPTKNYFFTLDSNQSNQVALDDFAGFKVDSSYSSTGDSIYLLSKKLRPINTLNACDTLVETYFGTQFIKKPNSTTLLNLNNDSIYFPKIHSQLNDWILYRYSNGEYIKAHIFHADTIRFKQNIDSLIWIRLTKHDTSHARIGTMDDTISLLKNNGWYKTLNWTHYPDSLKTFSYNRSEFELMTKGEVYNFNIGDEFHLTINEYNDPPDFMNIKILQKNISGDSVTYVRDIKDETNIYDGSIWPPIRTSYSHYTDTITYTDINQMVGGLPEAFGPNNRFVLTKNVFTSNGSDRFGYTLEEGYNFFANQYCAASAITERTFIKGCGSLDYTYSNSSNLNIHEQLMYYKKGTHRWGTPHIITGLASNKQAADALKIFPNPAQRQIQIESPKPLKSLRLHEMNGRLIKSVSLQQKNALDISDLRVGFYFIEIKQADGKIFKDKLIINR